MSTHTCKYMCTHAYTGTDTCTHPYTPAHTRNGRYVVSLCGPHTSLVGSLNPEAAVRQGSWSCLLRPIYYLLRPSEFFTSRKAKAAWR